jgi:peptidoglycan/LPS O-acetylase OafA/YrhL
VFVTTGGIFLWNITYANNILQAIDLEKVPEEFWHLWSLCVEEQFYLFFPFFIFFVKRKMIPYFLIAGIVVSVAGRFIGTYSYNNSASYTLMPLCLDSLFGGVMLAYLKTFHAGRLAAFFKKTWLVAGAIATATIGILFLCYKQNEVAIYTGFRFLGSMLGFLLIGYSVMIRYTGIMRRFLENRFIAMLGKISYGIYLLHPFIEKLYYKYADQNAVRIFLVDLQLPVVSNRYVIDFLFLFLATISISYLSFQLVEKRFLKLKQLFS